MTYRILLQSFATLTLSVSLTIILIFYPGLKAEATFPGKPVAHGNPSDSDEYHDPEFSKVHEFVKQGKTDKALDILEIKIKNKLTRPTALILKSLILNDQNRPLAALTGVMKAVNLQMRHPSLQFALCQIHRNMGQKELATRACIIAVQQHPNAPEVHYERAQTLMAVGNMNEANKELKQASKLDPNNPLYPYERGLIFTYLNDPDRAQQAFEKALVADANHLDSAYQLAYIQAVSNRVDKAKELISHILRSDQRHPKQRSARVLSDYIEKKSLDKLPQKIEPAEYHKSRSKAFYKSGKFGLSLLEIQTASKIKPDDLKIQEILIGLSGLLLRINIEEPAVKKFIEMTRENETSQARGYQKLGDIMVLKGDLDKAGVYYEKAIELGDPKYLAKTSLDELPIKKKIGVIPLKPTELFDNPTDALNRTGEVFAHYTMYKSALGMYSLALQMNPQHRMTMLNIGAAHYKMKKYNRAITVLEKTLATYPNHPDIEGHRLLLARSYVKKGDWQGGVKNLRALIQLNPRYKEIVKTDPIFSPLHDKDYYNKLME